jgi:hypothetical protein
MQHSCHRCGNPVEDGTPFCRQCNAPQIKVAPAERPTADLPPYPESAIAQSEPQSPHSRPIEWRSAWPAIFFVAVPAGLLSLPLNILFFVWTFAAGALTVSTYRKRTRLLLTPGMAVRLGLLTGIVAYGVFLILFLIALRQPEISSPLRQQIHSTIERVAANNPDPGAKQLAQHLTTPDGIATVLTMVAGMYAFLFLLFSVLGAVAAATVFAPKDRAP